MELSQLKFLINIHFLIIVTLNVDSIKKLSDWSWMKETIIFEISVLKDCFTIDSDVDFIKNF